MKLFGKELFSFKKEPELMWDFAQFGLLINSMQFIAIEAVATTNIEVKKTKKKKREKILITPKGLHQMKSLNDNKFVINVNPDYLKKQIQIAKEKLELMGKNKKSGRDGQIFEGGAIKYGREELESIIERFKNRQRFKDFKDIVEKYPHTTSKLLNAVIQINDHLRCQQADSFVPDFPKEAIKIMKEYNEMCIELCNKKTVFYVLAKKEDFEKRDRRRDPILLAQSPFGFFWQILGAWEEEMVYLGDL